MPESHGPATDRTARGRGQPDWQVDMNHEIARTFEPLKQLVPRSGPVPGSGEPPSREALSRPGYRCGQSAHPDGPRHESDSPLLRSLRERVREVNKDHEHWRGLM